MYQDTKTFGLMLPAVAEMMDEQGLSKDQALNALNQMLGDRIQNSDIQEAIMRLKQTENDLAFRYLLGQESLRAMGMDISDDFST